MNFQRESENQLRNEHIIYDLVAQPAIEGIEQR